MSKIVLIYFVPLSAGPPSVMMWRASLRIDIYSYRYRLRGQTSTPTDRYSEDRHLHTVLLQVETHRIDIYTYRQIDFYFYRSIDIYSYRQIYIYSYSQILRGQTSTPTGRQTSTPTGRYSQDRHLLLQVNRLLLLQADRHLLLRVDTQRIFLHRQKLRGLASYRYTADIHYLSSVISVSGLFCDKII